jgi:acetate kinase
MAEAILVFNAGSSSIKFALYEIDASGSLSPHLHGLIEGIGAAPHLLVRNRLGQVAHEQFWPVGAALTHEDLLTPLLELIEAEGGEDRIRAVSHRIVHGGARHFRPVRIDSDLLAELDALTPLAPLHQPHNLAPVRAIAALRPGLAQIACFDTAFHRSMPLRAERFPLPRALFDQGIRRYGFHGISYEYVSRRLYDLDREAARGRVIAAHLGNGASLCAMEEGRSVDTTMGFTALEGLMMGTRSGSIDPGVVIDLIRRFHHTPDSVEDLLYRHSGLLGVSEISADMRTLLASSDPRAAEAIALFVYRAAREMGGLIAVLGGADAIVFTGGIGEHAAPVRAAIMGYFDWLGVRLDMGANAAGQTLISAPESRVKVFVIPTDEERMLAEHALECLAGPVGS